MTSRRALLAAFVGGTAVGGAGTYAGLSATASGYGSVSWINEGDEEVRVETTVTTDGGLFSDSGVAYESEYRIPPTGSSRSGDTNVVETDAYDVEVVVRSTDRAEEFGPFTTRWVPADCYHQELIVEIRRDATVEFVQNRC